MNRWRFAAAFRRSSTISAPDFFRFLRRALALIAADQPDAHLALITAMGRMRARLVANGEMGDVWFDPPDWMIGVSDRRADLEVSFDREVILDLVAGRLTLADAVDQERLRLLGAVEMIESFHAALLTFLEGLVRTSAAPAILKEYRQS
jgi:hypothetical protein